MALLNVLTGYIAQLQEEMKRETEDTFAERACSGRHPGKAATGLYCKMCHDSEMGGKFGSIPGGGTSLVFPDEEQAVNAGLGGDDLSDVSIALIKE